MTEPAGVATCAEEILVLLRAHGVDVLFLNPGTDSAPLQEAIAALSARSVEIPRVITCSYESVALAAAHGYWQMTRRAQAVVVHVDVGTQNLGAMVHNVLRDRAGVLVLAGKTPYGIDADAVGGRSNEIHWHQDVPDQAGIVRSYARWTAELTRRQDVPLVIGRALQVAQGGRAGLAYLMLPRDVLMEAPSAPVRRRIRGFARPTRPAAEPAALADLARRLSSARRPLVITSRIGRSPDGTAALGRLADLAIPVAGRPEAVNLPTEHPMRVRPSATSSLIADADLIVILDSDVPWIPRVVMPAPDATVIQIDPDPVKADMPLWGFPVDVAITADGAVAAAQLAEALDALGTHSAEQIAARRGWIESAKIDISDAGAASSGAPRVGDVVTALNELLADDDIVVAEAVSNDMALLDGLRRSKPGTLCTPGGPGLGWALGASVGIKLARPSARVVAVVGDGAFMFGVPTAALCLANEASAPFLAVVLNNNGYRASRTPVRDLYPDGAASAAGDVPGTRFSRPPDFAELGRACGAHGERVVDRADLRDALTRALAQVTSGRSAIVDVVLAEQ